MDECGPVYLPGPGYIRLPPHQLLWFPQVRLPGCGGLAIETVDSTGDVGYRTSLVLDTSNYPHISYWVRRSPSVGDLNYAYQDAGGWHIETVDITGLPIWHQHFSNSLALDTSGYPRISYYDSSNHTLNYARGPILVSNLTQGTRHLTISEAVAAASSGDVLQVAGTNSHPVYDNATVDVESLTIQASPGTPGLVVAADAASDILRVTADYVTITGLTISGASSATGIHLDGASHCQILSTRAINCLKGIWLQGSSP